MNSFYQAIIFLLLFYFSSSQFHLEKYKHVPSDLSESDFGQILSKINILEFKEVLQPILVERVAGTKSHAKVKNFITNSFIELGWSVEHDAFIDQTPTHGPTNFTNIVAKLNPDAPRFLVIAAHYDSKYFPQEKFIGATDSAVPCAMMIYIAQTLKAELEQLKKSDVSLMFIFFDGEEAFDQWTATDSLYGSRHLAKVWGSAPYPADSRSTTELHRIDVFVLLDLIGAANPTFYSYFTNTHSHYRRLVAAEEKLTRANLIHRNNKRARYFKEKSTSGRIGDDHEPFLKKGVEIVHLIANPFPDVWHTIDDNEYIIDYTSTLDIVKVLEVFILEYLQFTH